MQSCAASALAASSPPGIRAKANVVASSHNKPVKLVILGTIVALTTWTVSANPHSDEGGKSLLAYLRAIAIKHEVTIVVVGHSNKGMRCAKSFFSDDVKALRSATNARGGSTANLG